MHNNRTQKKSLEISYCIGGHRALTDDLPASQDVRCRALSLMGRLADGNPMRSKETLIKRLLHTFT